MKSILLSVFILIYFLQVNAQNTISPEKDFRLDKTTLRMEHMSPELVETIYTHPKKIFRQQDETVLDSTINFEYASEYDSVYTSKNEYFWNGPDYTRYNYIRNGDEWVLRRKINYLHNENEQLLLYWSYLWDNGQNEWQNDNKIEFIYNEDGYEETLTSLIWDNSYQIWFKDFKDSTEYDDMGNVTRYTLWIGDGNNEWKPDWTSVSEYDENGSLVVETDSYWVDDQEDWRYDKKREYIYEEGFLVTSYVYLWMVTDNEWVLNEKSEYTYDTNGNQTLVITYFLNNNDVWIKNKKTVSVYDDENRVTLDESSQWNNTSEEWIYDTKKEYIYDDNDNVLSIAFYNWDEESDSWVGSYKKDRAYNEEGYILVSITSYWDYSTAGWDAQLKTYYYRSTATGIITSGQEILRIYPNPFHLVLNIKKATPGSANCYLSEPSGKIVMPITLTNGKNQFNLEHLPAGIYFLQYLQNGKYITKKVIKQ